MTFKRARNHSDSDNLAICPTGTERWSPTAADCLSSARAIRRSSQCQRALPSSLSGLPNLAAQSEKIVSCRAAALILSGPEELDTDILPHCMRRGGGFKVHMLKGCDFQTLQTIPAYSLDNSYLTNQVAANLLFEITEL